MTAIALLLLLTPAGAAFADVAALDRQVAATLGAAAGMPGGALRPIDTRLRLAPCTEPTIVEPPTLGAVTVRCAPAGWRIRVPLMAPGRPAADAQRPLVQRGDPVTLVVDAPGLSVTGTGIAEEDGAVGAFVRVRPQPGAAPVSGQVQPDGRVVISAI